MAYRMQQPDINPQGNVFEYARDGSWESEGRENDEPAFGWFSSALPTYDPTRDY